LTDRRIPKRIERRNGIGQIGLGKRANRPESEASSFDLHLRGDDSMGGPIVRTGTTPEFWKNWDRVFGDKKAAGEKGGKTSKKTAGKSKTTGKSKPAAAKKSAKNAAKSPSKAAKKAAKGRAKRARK
jgi:hypothetical protein